jgi:hypothetical protein
MEKYGRRERAGRDEGEREEGWREKEAVDAGRGMERERDRERLLSQCHLSLL